MLSNIIVICKIKKKKTLIVTKVSYVFKNITDMVPGLNEAQ